MKSIVTILLLIMIQEASWSQSVISSAGQSASNNTMQASATVGEAIIGSNNSNEVQANQGFQQPLQTDITTSIYTPLGKDVDLTLSPNPVQDLMTLTFSEAIKNITIKLHTNTGALVRELKYDGSKTVLQESLYDLKAGLYYLSILSRDGRRLASLPLIKI